MKNFTFTLRDIYTIAEQCLSRHRNAIRVYTETRDISLGEYVEQMSGAGMVPEVQTVLKRTSVIAKRLVVHLIHRAFHDRYLTLTNYNTEEMRVNAAVLFLGDDIDEIMELADHVFAPTTTAISKLLDIVSENPYSLVKYQIVGSRLTVAVGDDLRHVVFKEQFGNKRWTGKRYTVTGKPEQDICDLHYDFTSVLSDEEEDVTFLGQLCTALDLSINEVKLPDAPAIIDYESDPVNGISTANTGSDDVTPPVGRVDVLRIRNHKPKSHKQLN